MQIELADDQALELYHYLEGDAAQIRVATLIVTVGTTLHQRETAH